MTSRRFLRFVLFCGLSCWSASASAQMPTYRIVPDGAPPGAPASPLVVAAGEVFTVSVRIDNPFSAGVFVQIFIAEHDGTQLELLSADAQFADSTLPTGSQPSLQELNTNLLFPGVWLNQVVSLTETFFFNPMSEAEVLEITYRNLATEPGVQTTIEIPTGVVDVAPGIMQFVAVGLVGGIEYDTLGTGLPIGLEELTVETSFEGAFIRGSCAGSNGPVGLSDVIALLEFTFSGGSVPCADACDIDDSGQVSLLDAISLLGFLFSGGAAPAAPTGDCGFDPTGDEVDCAATPTNCP